MSATRRSSKGKQKNGNGGGQDLSPEDVEGLLDIAKKIPQLSDEEKRALLRTLTPQRKRSSEIEKEQRERAVGNSVRAPQNDDELWQFIKDRTGFEIPRVAVCDDHQAPFDFLSDAYFNRKRAILVMASREAGKTLGVSILHVVNAETKPGIESVTFGAVLSQAKRAYRHVKSFIYTKDASGNKIPRPEIEGDPTRMETNYKSGSLIELITGSKSGVNSPHPQVVHADEIDLIIDIDVWTESRNMSSSGVGEDGKRIPALDIATSTRKSTKGLMQQLIDEVAEAKRNGHKPAWEIYTFCVAEVAEEVPICRCADPIERVHRLVKLGRDPRELCECDTIVKGEWREGVPRSLESVCRGRFFKSRGWMPYEDIVGKFHQNSQIVWEAQMECRRPMADGIYLPTFSRQRHCIRGWVPRPEYGRIFNGVDWGGAAPSVCIWFQGPLPHPIEISGFDHQPVVIPQGSYVAFDQIECPSMGATKFGDEVVEKEDHWREQFPGWRVRGRFTDMAGRQQREDWHEHNPPLRTHWYISRDFDPTVETMQDLVGDGKLFLDITRCDSLAGDFESWRQKNGKEVQDASTHGPAAARYGLANVVVLERKEKKRGESSKILPVVKERGMEDPSGAIPALNSGRSVSGSVQTERWRETMGMSGSSGHNRGQNGWRIA